MRTYATEFPRITSADIPEFIRDTEWWRDDSWHNNSCPSFFNERTDVLVYVDASDVARREDPSAPRFIVQAIDRYADGNDVLAQWETDDETQLRALIADATGYGR